MIMPMKTLRELLKIKTLSILLIVTQSCSVSQLGNELAENFDDPLDSSINEKNSNKKEISLRSKEINNNKLSLSSDNVKKKYLIEMGNNENSQSKLSIASKVNPVKQEIEVFNPQPYRIIIKLSGANPSAPAESVTKALRKAGIQFEVEKIERFSIDSDSQALPRKR